MFRSGGFKAHNHLLLFLHFWRIHKYTTNRIERGPTLKFYHRRTEFLGPTLEFKIPNTVPYRFSYQERTFFTRRKWIFIYIYVHFFFFVFSKSTGFYIMFGLYIPEIKRFAGEIVEFFTNVCIPKQFTVFFFFFLVSLMLKLHFDSTRYRSSDNSNRFRKKKIKRNWSKNHAFNALKETSRYVQ